MTLQDYEKYFYEQMNKVLQNPKQEEREFVEHIKVYCKNATNGKLEDRKVLKDYIKYQITRPRLENRDKYEDRHFTVDEVTINHLISFNQPEGLSAQDQFEILLYHYSELNELGYDMAFSKLCDKHSYIKEGSLKMQIHQQISQVWCEYTEEDLRCIYQSENINLTFDDQLSILAQRLYQDLFGLMCIDLLAYSDVNGVGFSNDGDYIYCWIDRKIRLSFLHLNEQEARIVQDRATSFDGKVGQLCTNNPAVLCDRADMARITAFQKPYFSARNLCIRIFNKRNYTFQNIITDAKQQVLIALLIKLGEKISLNGAIGSGKSTAMQVLYEVISDELHIGTVEDYFEQHNSKKYLNKRFVEAQMIEGKSLLDAVKDLFRADIDVASVGEVRDGEAMFAFIQLSQALAEAALFTTHIATYEDTIPRLKNLLITTGKYFTEQSAVSDLVSYLNQIFQCKIIDGKRCISQMVEVVPLIPKAAPVDLESLDFKELERLALIQRIQNNPAYMYRLNPLLVLENGEFKFKHHLSTRLVQKAKTLGCEDLLEEVMFYITKDLG